MEAIGAGLTRETLAINFKDHQLCVLPCDAGKAPFVNKETKMIKKCFSSGWPYASHQRSLPKFYTFCRRPRKAIQILIRGFVGNTKYW